MSRADAPSKIVSFLGGESDSFLGRGWRHELNLTTDGTLRGSISSMSYNFGFHRRVLDGEDKATTMFMNRVWNSEANSLKGALGDYVDEVDGKFLRYSNLDEMMSARAARTGKEVGSIGRNIAKFGGGANMLAIGLTGLFATYAGLSEWKRTGSIVQGGIAFGKDLATGILMGKGMGLALSHPIIAGAAIGAGIGVYSVYNSKNSGNSYLSRSRFSEFSGGVSPGAMSKPGFTMRQRAMQSMEFSKFNVQRAIGNESLGAHTAKMRYSHNAPVNVLGY